MTVVIGVIEKVWWGKRENINEGKKKKKKVMQGWKKNKNNGLVTKIVEIKKKKKDKPSLVFQS